MAETKVAKGSLPFAYSFVPKGNVFITSNCRKLTQEKRRSVYIVTDSKQQQIGISVPTEVYVAVQFKEMETRAKRAANVLKRDEGIANGFQKEIMKIFPKIPPDALRNVTKIALEKGKGKVGRVGKLNVQSKVRLAVWAHVRHCETDYDLLLRNGLGREDARQYVEPKIKEVCKAWAAGSKVTRRKPGKPRYSAARPSTAASQATKLVKQDSKVQAKKHPETSSLTTATANAGKPKTTKTTTQITNERNAAIRNARRAHRQKQSLLKSGRTEAKKTKQQEGPPKTPRKPAAVVATAASFREKRTPKPRFIQPIECSAPSAPRSRSPRKVRARWTNPAMPNLSQKNRAQILRLVGEIDKIERADRISRKKKRKLMVTRMCAISSLNTSINSILADADMEAIDCSISARKDLVRRLEA